MSISTQDDQARKFYVSSARKLARQAGWAGACLLTALALLAIFPNFFAPYDPTERVAAPLQKPSAEYLLGTNDVGQDLLSELIAGTRASLFIGLIVSASTVFFGTWVGMLGGLLGGWIDSLLMRLTDLVLVLPFLPLVILLTVYLGPSQHNIIILLAIFFWAAPARLIRARVLSIHSESYFEAARALGSSTLGLITRHCWPGVRSLALTQVVLVASASILAESSLSFLGLGDPSGKSWGTMLYFARASGAFLGDAWKWWVLPAGAMITLTVLSLVLLGYSLEHRSVSSN